MGKRPTGPSFVARRRHFLDHLAPLAKALDLPIETTPKLIAHANRLGVKGQLKPQRTSDVVCVASIADLKMARRGPWKKAIYLCHGIGQTYRERERIHDPGGHKGPFVSLFLCPNEATAERLAEQNPTAKCVVIGQPKLDEMRRIKCRDETVALSFRWRQTICPESCGVLDLYKPKLRKIRKAFEAEGIKVIGHGHPRIWSELEAAYEKAGIEPVEDFHDVVKRASVYACDNSSTLFEFAALGRPVVVMNSPTYRRDVEHGGRFWEWADVGIQVDRPEHLALATSMALVDPDSVRRKRRKIAQEVLPHVGTSTKLAAAAIRHHMEERELAAA